MAGAGFVVTREVLDWLEALSSGGAFVVNQDGSGGFSPQVDRLVRAMHVVLAGGEVEVVVKVPGDEVRATELNDKLKAAQASLSASTRSLTSFTP